MRKNFNRSRSRKSIPIYSETGHRIGSVSGDTFHKTLKAAHFLTSPPAIAFDIKSLKDAERSNAVKVEVKALESGARYCAPISLIWKQGTRFNRGYGEQIYLPLSAWEYKGPRKAGVSPKKDDPKPTPPSAAQLSLFSR